MLFFKKFKKRRIKNSNIAAETADTAGINSAAKKQPLPLVHHINDPDLRRKQSREDLSQILHTPGGQRYLSRLVAMSGALAPSYSPSCPYATAYNEGLRRMGLFILAEAEEVAPEALQRLLAQGQGAPVPGTPLQ